MKAYELKITPKSSELVYDSPGDKKTQREIDIHIISELLRIYGTKQADITKYASITETMAEFDCLEGDIIQLDKDQLEYLKEGWKMSAGDPVRNFWDRYENGPYVRIFNAKEVKGAVTPPVETKPIGAVSKKRNPR